ncbi:hypothetical protein PoB_004825900 [Plakobranchus ocellatus]|uniref:Uncharacterized protein n=1 Tax=Plakobranchus ocellatus TaxID=259542 RepID=A0AAV4BNR6_9GAST|nr:hypothetical protein PoB_004825900 [Plakobranchus ocellatus]
MKIQAGSLCLCIYNFIDSHLPTSLVVAKSAELLQVFIVDTRSHIRQYLRAGLRILIYQHTLGRYFAALASTVLLKVLRLIRIP